jgi:hypothetical protein
MKDRVVILTGAGFVCGSDFSGVSTLDITNDFIFYNHPDLTDDKDFIKFIYDEFCFWNKLDPNNIKENLVQINFETIIQLIEEIFVYVEDIERSRYISKYQNSAKTTVFSINNRIITHISRVRIPKWQDAIYLFVEKAHNHLIDIIIGRLKNFDIDSTNKGMIEFNNFISTTFANNEAKRIYTLNYDTWLNRFGGFFDGFNNYTLESKEVLFNRDIDCHYNLHGYILWDLFGTSKKFQTPEVWKNHQSFAGYTIAREAILPSPIITGYNKLTRINLSPFLELFHSFTMDCSVANKYLIIGYSFGDPHVNNILRLIPISTKIVIVVYYNISCLKDLKSDFHKMIFELKQIFRLSFSNLSIRNGLNYTIDSDDKRLSIFINGIGQSFYKEYSQI